MLRHGCRMLCVSQEHGAFNDTGRVRLFTESLEGTAGLKLECSSDIWSLRGK